MRIIKKAQRGVAIDKTSTGSKRDVSKDIRAERDAVKKKNKELVNKHINKARQLRKDAAVAFKTEVMNDLPHDKKNYDGVKALNKAAKTQDSLANVNKKTPKYKPALKNGGSVKTKDGKWMQKAAASIKKRGTAGKCTPISKPGCTGKAKALAKTFK
jgi:hypothetical protein